MITKARRFLVIGLLVLAATLLGLATNQNNQTIAQQCQLNPTEITNQDILPGEKLLQDDFYRANADTLGSPWVEENEVTTEYINPQGKEVGPGYIELNNGALAFHYNNHSQKTLLDDSFNQAPYVIAPLSKSINTYPVTLYFTFTPHADERIYHVVGLMSKEDGLTPITDLVGRVYFLPRNGLGVLLTRTSSSYDNTTLSVVKYVNEVETVLGQENLTFQFESGTEYTIQMTIGRTFGIQVVASSPTEFNGFTYEPTSVPFLLDQFFIVDQQGGISSGTIGPGDYRLFFDNILVQQTYQVHLPTVIWQQ